MKRFEELSDEEVLALDDEGVARWIDIECACEGVPLLPPRPVPPIEPAILPDMTVYEVAGVHFEKAEDANQVAVLIAGMPRFDLQYVSGPRYEKKAVPKNDAAITPVRVFSCAAWDKVKDMANAYTERKSAYDNEEREYAKASSRRDRTAAYVRERVESVWEAERERRQMRAHLDRYLSLADGDRDVAVKFLKAAYPDAGRLLPELNDVAA